MSRFLIAGLAILLLGTGATAQAKDDLWVHVSVDGGHDDEGERVRVNVPLQLVSTILPLIEHDEFHGGRIRLDDEDLDHEDVVAILRAVAEADEGEYVTIEDDDDIVHVSKKDKVLTVQVRDRDEEDGDHVDIQIPVSVLQALVSGDEDELDVMAAIEALGKEGKGNLVTVNDEDGTLVKVWIDDRNLPEDD